MKAMISVLLLALSATHAFSAIDRDREVSRVERRLAQGKAKEDTDRALDAMIKLGADKLRDRGYKADADLIEETWNTQFKGFLLNSYDLGDHPAIPWLLSVWQKLDDLLGSRIMEMLHLDDIRVFAFAIPVVFTCADAVDSPEYKLHWVPFLGSLSYWVSYLVCTFSAPAPFSVMCGLLGVAVEAVVRKTVAPRTSDWAWERACVEGA